MTEPNIKAACKTAVLMLGRRSYSSRRLLEKLLVKGYGEEAAAGAVAWCVQQRFLDDETLAGRLAEQQASRGYGARRIRDYLRSKGFEDELIERVLQTSGDEQDAEVTMEKLVALCHKLHKEEEWDNRERARVSAALARRGFGWDEIRSALRRVTDEE